MKKRSNLIKNMARMYSHWIKYKMKISNNYRNYRISKKANNKCRY